MANSGCANIAGSLDPVLAYPVFAPNRQIGQRTAGWRGLAIRIERRAAALTKLGILIVLGEAASRAGPLQRGAAFHQLLDQLPYLPRDQGHARQDHQHRQQPAQLRGGGEIPKPYRGHGNNRKVESIQKGGKSAGIGRMFHLVDEARVDEDNRKESKKDAQQDAGVGGDDLTKEGLALHQAQQPQDTKPAQEADKANIRQPGKKKAKSPASQ